MHSCCESPSSAPAHARAYCTVGERADANRDAVGQMIALCERDRAAGDAEVRARLQSWIPEYAPPAGAPVKPLPAAAPAADDGARAPTPLRAPRRRSGSEP